MKARIKVLETNLALVCICLIFFLIRGNIVFIYIAGGIGLLTLFIKLLARFLADGWMKLATLIGKVISGVLLAMIYYIVLVPTALLYRLLNRKGSMAADTTSFFKVRDGKATPEHIENPW